MTLYIKVNMLWMLFQQKKENNCMGGGNLALTDNDVGLTVNMNVDSTRMWEAIDKQFDKRELTCSSGTSAPTCHINLQEPR